MQRCFRPAARAVVACLAAMRLLVGSAAAEDGRSGGLETPTVWDLALGSHAAALPAALFAGFACGTNGGPPSRPLGGWRDYASCRPEPATGLHEVYFEYDDEIALEALARRLEVQAAIYGGTSVYGIPVIASALFSDDGFLMGLRLVSDPRVDVRTREQGAGLAGFLKSRFGDHQWDCQDLPRAEGETEFRGAYVKQRCTMPDGDTVRVVETHLYRKPGQLVTDPVSRLPTEGQFASVTRYEEILVELAGDRPALAAAALAAHPDEALAVARARDCQRCDLSGASLKRADLTGANLAGANLAGANLHGANLTRADLTGANLAGANLNGANLTSALAAGADLTKAMLYGAILDGADLRGASLREAMAGHARMTSARLDGASALEADLSNVRLSGASLIGAELSGTLLDDAVLVRADLTRAKIAYAFLWRANLSDAVAPGADFSHSELLSATLRGADLSGSDLTGAKLTGARLAGVRLDGARLADTEFPAGFSPPETGRGD